MPKLLEGSSALRVDGFKDIFRMSTFLTILHVLFCLFLIGVVLLQSGRSGGMGVLSGAASQQVFGGRGAGNFLQRLTTIVAFMFLATCTALGYFSSSTHDRGLNSDNPSTTLSTGDGGASGDASASGDARATGASSTSTTTTPTPAEPTPAAETAGDAGAAAAPSEAPAATGGDQ